MEQNIISGIKHTWEFSNSQLTSLFVPVCKNLPLRLFVFLTVTQTQNRPFVSV